jgi:glycosyltransferase involved in cell wall biosynthesis
MNLISVVIITRNEENNIVDCIHSARLISDDIIIVDAGSEDDTLQLSAQSGARTFSVNWQGYGFSRNFGAEKAKYNWILALDADERISPELASSINRLALADPSCIYQFRRRNFLGKHEIRFGTLGFETVKRLYNRKRTEWDLTLVHEKLLFDRTTLKQISGAIMHYGLKSYEDYKGKAILYAQMSAEKYFIEGKKTSFLKRIFSPFFNSVKSYLFQFGFLDGVLGFKVARTIAYYSWLKYYYLHHIVFRTERKEKIVYAAKPKMETISN